MIKYGLMERDGKMDNLKGILIILVVLGHMTELVLRSGDGGLIYRLIYAFHMPAFIFISGYFARTDLRKILLNMLWPYLVFQSLYILFANTVLGDETGFTLIKPYWIMWYIFAMIVWSLILPLFTFSKKTAVRISLFTLTVIISILSGFSEIIGMKFSLSRILVYLPFFISGNYCHDIDFSSFYARHRKLISMTAAIAFGAVFAAVIIHRGEYSYVWLYENAPYDVTNEPVSIRAIHLLFAYVFIAYMILLTPHHPIKLLSTIGQRTMPVYLLHGFVIKLLVDRNIGPLIASKPDILMYAILIIATAVIVLVLSSDAVLKIFSPLMKLKRIHKDSSAK